MRYTCIIEKNTKGSGYGAYVPDLPGCVAVGDSEEEVAGLLRSAMQLHLEGLRRDGEPVPPPSTRSLEIEVSV